MAGDAFTRGQHHANKIALNLCNFGSARWEHPKNFTPWATRRRKAPACTAQGCAPAAAGKAELPRAAELGALGSFSSQARERPGRTCLGLARPSSSGLREGAGCLQHLEAISERLRCPADVRRGESSSPAQEGGG